MPYALILIGVVLVITAAQNTYAQFAQQLQSDAGGFAKFAVAIGIVGAAGYVEDLRGISRAFMGLIVLSIILANGKNGLFANLQNAVSQGPALITPPTDASAASGNAGVDPTTGANMGSVLTGQGLTGNSTSTGANTTSTPTLQNWSNWLTKSLPAIFGGTPQ